MPSLFSSFILYSTPSHFYLVGNSQTVSGIQRDTNSDKEKKTKKRAEKEVQKNAQEETTHHEEEKKRFEIQLENQDSNQNRTSSEIHFEKLKQIPIDTRYKVEIDRGYKIPNERRSISTVNPLREVIRNVYRVIKIDRGSAQVCTLLLEIIYAGLI